MKKMRFLLSLGFCFLTILAHAEYKSALVLPQGSYSETCTGCLLNYNNVLSCACADRQGIPHTTILPDVRSCAIIENNNGSLVCTSWKEKRYGHDYRRHHYETYTTDVQAGPIWNQSDAEQKCPAVCGNVRGEWSGQWTTIISGQASICECRLSRD